jgi:hypothetical protein
MWTCKKCNTIIEEDDFDTCWNCQNSKEDNLSERDNLDKEIIKDENKMKIILGDNSEHSQNINHEAKKENSVKPNLFQGGTEAEKGNAKFPEWDIVPPNQFINPRIKP